MKAFKVLALWGLEYFLPSLYIAYLPLRGIQCGDLVLPWYITSGDTYYILFSIKSCHTEEISWILN